MMGADVPLVIGEDDPDDLYLIHRALQRAWPGIVTQDYRNGRDLLHDLRQGLRPRALLLDLNMPIVDGRQVLQAMRSDKLLAQIPVTVLTTSVEQSDRQSVLGLGARQFLSKPTTLAGYVDILQQALEPQDNAPEEA